MEEAPFVSTGGSAMTVRIVEGGASASMVGSVVDAMSVEEAAFVSTDYGAIGASSVQQFDCVTRRDAHPIVLSKLLNPQLKPNKFSHFWQQ